jgi:hypothetical protein
VKARIVTFIAEMFKIMNHANLDLPNTTALAASGATGSAGVIVSTTTTLRQLVQKGSLE